MPIRPENRDRYPANWKQIRAAILKRASNGPHAVQHPVFGKAIQIGITADLPIVGGADEVQS